MLKDPHHLICKSLPAIRTERRSLSSTKLWIHFRHSEDEVTTHEEASTLSEAANVLQFGSARQCPQVLQYTSSLRVSKFTLYSACIALITFFSPCHRLCIPTVSRSPPGHLKGDQHQPTTSSISLSPRIYLQQVFTSGAHPHYAVYRSTHIRY